jgi:hypothetical protein
MRCSILRLDAESLGDGGELAGLVLDCGGEFSSPARIAVLADLDQARFDPGSAAVMAAEIVAKSRAVISTRPNLNE